MSTQGRGHATLLAEQVGLSPEEFLRFYVEQLLEEPDDKFRKASVLCPPEKCRTLSSVSVILSGDWDMRLNLRIYFLTVLILSLIASRRLAAQEDIADITSQDLAAGKDENKRYFLIGPPKESKAPKSGYSLLVVLPGGSGDADFHPFVKRIFKNALPEGYILARPMAHEKWTENQEIIWPPPRTK